MSLGKAAITRMDYARPVQLRKAKAKTDYQSAASVGFQRMQSDVPRDTNALALSSKVEMLETMLGFMMRSFGDDASGKAYARWVNEGHHQVLKSGGVKFIPAQPYFDQAVKDAGATLRARQRSR